MLINYSLSSKNLIGYSKEYAKKLGHDYCGMEHILLGLVNSSISGLASKALNNVGVTEEKVLKNIESIIGIHPYNNKFLGLTPRAKKVLKISREESKKLKKKNVEPIHILLGLMREGENPAIKIFMNCSVDPQELFNEIVKLLKEN